MEKDEKIQNKIVQTYAHDMAKVIEDDRGGGLIKKIIHGAEEHEKEKKNLSPQSRKNRYFMLVSLLLLFLAVGTLLIFIFKKSDSPIDITQQFVPIIFTDKSVFLDVKGLKPDEITQTILKEVDTAQVKTGGVEGIYLTEDNRPIGLRRFITLINAKFIPGEEVFVSDEFLLGAVNSGTSFPVSDEGQGGDFFILLKARAQSDIFEGLHNWEPDMFSDLRGFFKIRLTSETKYLQTKAFEDGIAENKNARALYDQDGKIVMMYIYADNTSVIFTNSSIAAREIMLRLASGKIKK